MNAYVINYVLSVYNIDHMFVDPKLKEISSHMLKNQTSFLLFISVAWHEILSFKSNMRLLKTCICCNRASPKDVRASHRKRASRGCEIVRPCERVTENIWNTQALSCPF